MQPETQGGESRPSACPKRRTKKSLVDFLAFRASVSSDDLVRLRARLVVTIALLSAPLWVLYGSIWYVIGLRDGLWLSLVGAGACLIWIAMQRWGLSPQASGRGLAVSAAGTFVCLAVFVRGFDLPLLAWNLLIPVAAVLFRGEKTAYGWIVVLSASWGLLWWLDSRGLLARPDEQLSADLLRLLDLSNLIGVMLVLVMIVGNHARVQAQQQLEREELRKQLTRAEHLAGLGTLAASIGHEINNPLAYTIHNLEYLSGRRSEGSETSNEDARALGDALEGATRVQRIAARLNAFARNTDPGPVRVARSVDIALDLARASLDQVARVQVRVPSDLTVSATDELVQVLLNLLVNAADAIRARTDSTEGGLIEVDAHSRGARVLIEVRDNGLGMPQEVRERVFEPFFTTKEPGRGTGLGLAISREIVIQLSGEISVLPRVPQGTVMQIRLPAALPSPPSVPSLRMPREPEERARVLVVDDEPALLRAMSRHLIEHRIDIAGDGMEALRALRQQAYDLILCDVMMPSMTGPELYERVREELGESSAHRFVFMTGGAFLPEHARALKRTGRPTLAKPVDQKAVSEQLKRLAKSRQRP